MRKIFVYEAIEISKQDGIVVYPYHKDIRLSKMKHKAAEKEKTQPIVTVTHTRFKVTICLYLSPNNKMRSLSTLIAVEVNKETPHNAALVMKAASDAYRERVVDRVREIHQVT